MHDKKTGDFSKSKTGTVSSWYFTAVTAGVNSSGRCLSEGAGAPGKDFENQSGLPSALSCCCFPLAGGALSCWQRFSGTALLMSRRDSGGSSCGHIQPRWFQLCSLCWPRGICPCSLSTHSKIFQLWLCLANTVWIYFILLMERHFPSDILNKNSVWVMSTDLLVISSNA